MPSPRSIIHISVLTAAFCILAAAPAVGQIGIYLPKATEGRAALGDTLHGLDIRGEVIDKNTREPLTGASVILVLDSLHQRGIQSDAVGSFRFMDVPFGVYAVRVSFIGYKSEELNLHVTGTREVNIYAYLEPSSTILSEITILAPSQFFNVGFGRTLDSRLPEVIAGNRSEPIRSFITTSGAQGADDSRNDIVIRGNSPQSVVWKLEGINIPNPNHFNIPGTAGGPVTMVNNQSLANSEFYSGTFPAEFGNTVSGIFDLHLRLGNEERHDFGAQAGFLGIEAFGEGPLNNKHSSSYLFSFRNSALEAFDFLGLNIGTLTGSPFVPRYRDVAFHLNFPQQEHPGSFSLFGLWGKSDIDILISKLREPTRFIYGENDRDQYFGSETGIWGGSFHRSTAAWRINVAVAYTAEYVHAAHDYVYRHLDANRFYVVDSLTSILGYDFNQRKVSSYLKYTLKMPLTGNLTFGGTTDLYILDFLDSARIVDYANPGSYAWRVRWDAQSTCLLLQPFVDWKGSLKKFDVEAGAHVQYFSLNKSFSPIEPRLSLRYHAGERWNLIGGAGLHSQLQAPYLYFYGARNDTEGRPVPINKNMGFTRDEYTVVGIETHFGRDSTGVRLRAEGYYQHLHHVPVEQLHPSFSLLNTGAGFTRFFPDTLVNKGQGENYGIEVNVERPLAGGYIFGLATTLFESKYSGSDGIWRNTDFNGNFIVNGYLTRQWIVGNGNLLTTGGRVTVTGGRRYGPVDMDETEKVKDVIFIDADRNALQFAPYFRIDVRINYKINRPKVAHELSVDLNNLTNTMNVLKLSYAPMDSYNDPMPVRKEYQLGLLPIFYYRLSFHEPSPNRVSQL